MLRDALRQREPGVAPTEALRLLARRLVAERSPYVEFSAASRRFVETIERIETLKARARAIRDELAQLVAVAPAERVDRDPGDPIAHMAAALLLAAWTTALIRARRISRQGRDAKVAQAAFLSLVDQGSNGLKAALAGTAYA